MSENLTLARPYARAAFELARGAGSLAAWGETLELAATVAADARFASLLGDPRLDEAGKIGLLLPEGEAAASAFAGSAFSATAAMPFRPLPVLFDVMEAHCIPRPSLALASAASSSKLASLTSSTTRVIFPVKGNGDS